MTKHIRIAAGLTITALGAFALPARAEQPNVYYTTVDGVTLIIDGADLAASKKPPHVFLGGSELPITTWTSTHIEAILGPRLPGTYSVLVTKNANNEDGHSLV